MKLNINNSGNNNTFNCERDGIIGMANFQRIFDKTGMSLIQDKNANCDESGRHNYFNLTYGNINEIKQI